MSITSLNILLVDDNLLILKALARQLRAYKIFFANNASSALEILQTETVDLIITDYSMIGGDGVALLETVRHFFPHIRRVLMNIDPPTNLAAFRRSHVVEYFLPKPFTPTMLQTMICSLVSFRSAERTKDWEWATCGGSDHALS